MSEPEEWKEESTRKLLTKQVVLHCFIDQAPWFISLSSPSHLEHTTEVRNSQTFRTFGYVDLRNVYKPLTGPGGWPFETEENIPSPNATTVEGFPRVISFPTWTYALWVAEKVENFNLRWRRLPKNSRASGSWAEICWMWAEKTCEEEALPVGVSNEDQKIKI